MKPQSSWAFNIDGAALFYAFSQQLLITFNFVENTIILAAVYGPKAISGRKENPECAIVEVIWKPKTGIAGSNEREAEFIVKRTLEHIILTAMHPNTAISVIIQVVNDDGGALACAMNAACAALVDAGVPLSGLIAAVTCAVDKEGMVFLDPMKKEEKDFRGHACLVFPGRPLAATSAASLAIDNEPIEHGIVSSVTKGALSADDYLNCLERGRAASAKIAEFARSSLERAQRGVEMVVAS
ncbi:hypothetical protein GOP47_0019996 [Adiantum capillus-veneris]|uniref:Exoribonuclease phosphorolytic domain-containing protein n=1 Tax=Adiantum capillus-veneris TaxID=13818 RepID=A0A9D4UC52_ADICA|nr:hypothetical protein GOP47_0019996 [Adiantum capillus-veneris]